MNVLIVEDDHDLLETMTDLLSSEFNIETAETVEGAKDILIRNETKVAVLDFMLPNGTAIDILEFIYNLVGEGKIAILIVSGLDCPVTVEDIGKYGIYDVIKKPCSGHRLLEKVREAWCFVNDWADAAYYIDEMRAVAKTMKQRLNSMAL